MVLNDKEKFIIYSLFLGLIYMIYILLEIVVAQHKFKAFMQGVALATWFMTALYLLGQIILRYE